MTCQVTAKEGRVSRAHTSKYRSFRYATRNKSVCLRFKCSKILCVCFDNTVAEHSDISVWCLPGLPAGAEEMLGDSGLWSEGRTNSIRGTV